MVKNTIGMVASTMLLNIVCAVVSASAQPLGSFRWQLQPYCNVITLAVVQQGSQYQLDGTDDQCGAAQAASVRGLAFLNPNGLIGIGLTIVTAPGGAAVHVDAAISSTSFSGEWRDSAGNSGSFVFTPGAAVPGGPRPVPLGGIAPGNITNIHIAAAAVGAAQINTAEVQARVLGTCAAGQTLTAINTNGTVTCQPLPTVAASNQVFTGQLSERYVANSGFTLAGGSFPLPLPDTAPTPIVEYVPGGLTANCPGIGQAGAGRICIYAYQTSNIESVSISGTASGLNRRHGFSVDVFPSNAASGGFLLASWAYRVP